MAPGSPAPTPVAEAINGATRALHADLNALILARLPLALPPCAADPALYLAGMLHVAPVYMAFEGPWHDLVHGAAGARAPSGNDAAAARGLASLYLPGLMRSGALRADLAALTGSPPSVVDERLRSAGSAGALAAFVHHIGRVVARKPHVLVAYAYIFFMALFSGGRVIRRKLELAGLPFWQSRPGAAPPDLHRPAHHHRLHPHHHHRPDDAPESVPRDVADDGPEPPAAAAMPLQFFRFDTPAAGQDLKHEFKQKLSESEARLTASERRDIEQEAVCIFENVILVVRQLDALCAGPHAAAALAPGYPWPLTGLAKNVHAVRDDFRDSIAVTRQRWEKKAAKQPLADAAAAAAQGGDPVVAQKSVRFDGPAPRPSRRGPWGAAGSPAAGPLLSSPAAQWLLATVLAALALAIFAAGRRTVSGWLRASDQ